MQQTEDGGFIVGGCSKSYGVATRNPWLIKTDDKGNEKWNRTYNYYALANLSGMLLGFGGIQITAIVDEGAKTTDGTQFFLFTLVKK